MTSHTADVVVVGGGPAGSAAAIDLATAGRDVVLIDKASFPRDKCCGDGLTTGALRRLERLGLQPAAVPSWQRVDDVVVRSVSGRVVRFPLPRGRGTYGAVAKRSELDHALLETARRSGVRVEERVAFCGARPIGGGVLVDTDAIGPIAARYVVAADGMWSAVRKAVLPHDEPGYLGEWHAFRQYRRTAGPDGRDLWVFFEEDLRPGYAWSFPLPNNEVNVGLGVLRRPGEPTRDLGRRFREVLTRSHIAAVLGDTSEAATPKAWPIPARIQRTALTAADGRVLFVGDAARSTDPMTGEGIGQALETAAMAAECIGRAGPFDARSAAARYEAEIGRTMAVDNRLAEWLSLHGLAHRKGIRAALRVAGSTPWTRSMFARWLFEDEPRAVLATPSRWHRHLFARPGAFAEHVAVSNRETSTWRCDVAEVDT
ncbi:MAG TPA: NAD(P)/FAD-dependent oxidoreductase [Acidimicrobiales bacterium]|nr:NAD(P)/FAD-dependent oxidoreductase [Acidimicrobiales bacterium]